MIATALVGYGMWNVVEKRLKEMTAPPIARQRPPAASNTANGEEDRAAALMRIREKQQKELEKAAAARAEMMRNASAEDREGPAKNVAPSLDKKKVVTSSTYNPLDGSSGGSSYSCSLKSRHSRRGGG